MLQNGLTRYDGIDYAAVYDYNTYVSRYSDVFRAYGYDDQAVLLHFIHYGMNEGRIAKASFDVTSWPAPGTNSSASCLREQSEILLFALSAVGKTGRTQGQWLHTPAGGDNNT